MINIEEKPMECKVRDTVLRIIERALMYNSTSTDKEITGNKPTFFVDFSGHIAQIQVSIYVEGWVEGWGVDSNPERYVVYLTENKYGGRTADGIRTQLVAILKRMEEVYSAWYEKEHENE